MVDKQSLAQRLEPLQPKFAAMIRTTPTAIRQIPTPFLRSGAIYQVSHSLRPQSVTYTVGCADPDFTVLLAANPEGYMRLGEKAGLRLETGDQRLAYLVTFLETTRSFGNRFRILNSAGEIQPRPNLSPQIAQRFQQLQDKYRAVIAPPEISAAAPWLCTVFALKGQDLVRLDLRLGPEGRIESTGTVLEKNVPVPYVL